MQVIKAFGRLPAIKTFHHHAVFPPGGYLTIQIHYRLDQRSVPGGKMNRIFKPPGMLEVTCVPPTTRDFDSAVNGQPSNTLSQSMQYSSLVPGADWTIAVQHPVGLFQACGRPTMMLIRYCLPYLLSIDCL